jgi:hypothetical protein
MQIRRGQPECLGSSIIYKFREKVEARDGDSEGRPTGKKKTGKE